MHPLLKEMKEHIERYPIGPAYLCKLAKVSNVYKRLEDDPDRDVTTKTATKLREFMAERAARIEAQRFHKECA